MEDTRFGVNHIRNLLTGIYLPFADIERAITWPDQPERLENDAEHSYSLALIGAEVASNLGLDADRAAAFGIVHDLLEVYAGDTSVWDTEGLVDKQAREHDAMERLKQEMPFSWMVKTLQEYETLATEEAKLIYALDKLVAVMILAEGDGYFWKENGITYGEAQKLYYKKREQVAVHPIVLKWYDELQEHLQQNQEHYFAPSKD